MVADEFDVILKEDCSGNVLTLQSSLADSELFVGESAQTYQIDYTASVADNACPITAKLYILSPFDETWIEYGSSDWTTFTGYATNHALYIHDPVVTSSLKTTNSPGSTGSDWNSGEF